MFTGSNPPLIFLTQTAGVEPGVWIDPSLLPAFLLGDPIITLALIRGVTGPLINPALTIGGGLPLLLSTPSSAPFLPPPPPESATLPPLLPKGAPPPPPSAIPIPSRTAASALAAITPAVVRAQQTMPNQSPASVNKRKRTDANKKIEPNKKSLMGSKSTSSASKLSQLKYCLELSEEIGQLFFKLIVRDSLLLAEEIKNKDSETQKSLRVSARRFLNGKYFVKDSKDASGKQVKIYLMPYYSRWSAGSSGNSLTTFFEALGYSEINVIHHIEDCHAVFFGAKQCDPEKLVAELNNTVDQAKLPCRALSPLSTGSIINCLRAPNSVSSGSIATRAYSSASSSASKSSSAPELKRATHLTEPGKVSVADAGLNTLPTTSRHLRNRR